MENVVDEDRYVVIDDDGKIFVCLDGLLSKKEEEEEVDIQETNEHH